MEQKSMKAWAAEAIDVSEAVAAALDKEPAEAAKLMSSFAEKVSSEQARREALGEPSLAGLRFAEDVGATMLGQAMEALSRQSIALARAGGLAPSGPAWGAYRAFFQNGSTDGKISSLMDTLSLEGEKANPGWAGAALGLAQEEGLRWTVGSKNKPKADAAPMRPADPITQEQLEFAASWRQALGSPMRMALQAPAGQERETVESILAGVAELKGEVAALEARTGQTWRAQQLPRRMAASNDIELRSAAFAALDMAERSGQNPDNNPKVAAGMGALVSMMSTTEAKNFCEALKRSVPVLGEGWDGFVAKQEAALDSKWTAGMATKGPRQPLGKPEFLIPSSVPFGQEMAHFGEKFKQEQARLVERARGGLSRVVSGFVQKFGSAVDSIRQEPSLEKPVEEKAFSDMPEPTAPRKRFSLGDLRSKTRAGLDAAIDKGNAWTDQLEASARSKAKSVLVSGAAALDSVVEGATSKATAARSAFEGKVGEAKVAMGNKAFTLAERVDLAVDSPDAQAHRHKAAQVASVAGAIFVGVAMAPVAGVLAATAGAVLAGMGLSNALKKAGEAFREKKQLLPPALETLGQRLGAKREAHAAARPAEPTVAAPSAPGF